MRAETELVGKKAPGRSRWRPAERSTCAGPKTPPAGVPTNQLSNRAPRGRECASQMPAGVSLLPDRRGFRSSLLSPASHGGPSASPHILAPAAFPVGGAVGTKGRCRHRMQELYPTNSTRQGPSGGWGGGGGVHGPSPSSTTAHLAVRRGCLCQRTWDPKSSGAGQLWGELANYGEPPAIHCEVPAPSSLPIS